MKRCKRFGQAIFLTLLMVLLLSAGGIAEKLLLTQGEVDELFENISSVTGLPFKEFPAIKVVSKVQLMGIFLSELSFISENIQGAADATLQSLVIQIYGKYSWLTKTIYLVEDDLKNAPTVLNTDAKTAQKLILTHEMVHALDDQYYGLRNLLAQCKDRERIVAIGALIEGHAVYVARQAYEHLGLNPDAFDPIWKSSTGINTMGETYYAGFQFVTQVLHQGISEEWLFARPPLFSHYILNPDLYIQRIPIHYANLSTIIKEDEQDSLPLNLRVISSLVIDKLTFSFILKYMGGSQELIDGFLTSYVCQMQQQYASQQRFSSNNILSLMVIQLSTPEYAKQYQEMITAYNIKQWETIEKDPNFTSNYPLLRAVYPTSFLNELQDLEDTIRATYFLDIVHDHYLVEILFQDIDISENELIRIIADLEERLSQIESSQRQ